MPETPVGRAVAEWLEAYNSSDSARLGSFYRKYQLERSLEAVMARRRSTGGYDIVAIERNDPQWIEFVVRERAGGNTLFGVMELQEDPALRLRQSAVVAIPPGGSAADFKIDSTTRTGVIDAVIARLHEHYVFPDVATRMAASMRMRLQRGEYNGITNGVSFASLLTEQLQSESRDRHLRVTFSAERLPDRSPDPDPASESYRRQMESVNCGFLRAEQLPGNTGYLKFDFFADPDVCGPTATAAMNFLANVDALIIDLRDNGGGHPRMVAYVTSYLFSKRTHLNDIWTRRTNETRESWTFDVPGKRLSDDKAVYVLISNRTFSGGEEFSYNLKQLKRATLIGETTGGGAHPVMGHRIDAHFTVRVPFARAINPISKTNWEGVGVEPDVKVPATDALATAQRIIAARRGGPPPH